MDVAVLLQIPGDSLSNIYYSSALAEVGHLWISLTLAGKWNKLSNCTAHGTDGTEDTTAIFLICVVASSGPAAVNINILINYQWH